MIKELRRTLSPVKFLIRDMGLYIQHILKGTSYAEYYADRMDRHIRRRPNWGLMIDRTFQVNYLKQKGMRSSSTLLDYGCGAVAAGLHMIEFLDAEKYLGLDVSKEAINEGYKRIEQAGHNSKKPKLVQIPGGNLESAPNQTFDYIWSYSVLTHMPADDIGKLFKNIQKFMHKGTQFYCDFALSNTGTATHKRFKDWYFPEQTIIELANKAGLNCEVQREWKSPEDPDNLDTMIKLTLK